MNQIPCGGCVRVTNCTTISTAAPVIGAQVVGVAIQVECCISNAIGHTAHNASEILGVVGLQV